MRTQVQKVVSVLVIGVFYAGIVLSLLIGGGMIYYIMTQTWGRGSGTLWPVTPYEICVAGGLLFIVFVVSLMIIAERPGKEIPGGVKLEQSDLPQLQELVCEAAESLGVMSPDEIIIFPHPTAAASEMPSTKSEGKRILILGWPFVTLLSHAELKALIGHELAHFDKSAFTVHQTLWQIETAMDTAQAFTTKGNFFASDSTLGAASIITKAYIGLFNIFFIPFSKKFRYKFELYCDERSAHCFGSDNLQNALSHTAIIQAIYQRFIQAYGFKKMLIGFYSQFTRYYDKFPLTEMFSIVMKELKKVSENHPTLMARTKRISGLPRKSGSWERLSLYSNEVLQMEARLITAFNETIQG